MAWALKNGEDTCVLPDQEIVVEFYGIPRLKAGVRQLHVSAATVAEALAAVAQQCPSLSEVVQAGRIAPQYLLSINGRRFSEDLLQPLAPHDQLILLSADAGG
jgi:molybdopterin converting factor small subunit